MTERREDVLQRLAGRTGPSDPALARAWEQQPSAHQQRLRRTATDPVAAGHLGDDLQRDIVAALADDRATRRPRDVIAPVALALLVLATIWGFGRAVMPSVAEWFLLSGVLIGLTAMVVGWRSRARRRERARAVRRLLRRR